MEKSIRDVVLPTWRALAGTTSQDLLGAVMSDPVLFCRQHCMYDIVAGEVVYPTTTQEAWLKILGEARKSSSPFQQGEYRFLYGDYGTAQRVYYAARKQLPSVSSMVAVEGGLVVADSVVALLRAVTPHAADCAKNTATFLIESVNLVRAVERLAHKTANYVEVLTNSALRDAERERNK